MTTKKQIGFKDIEQLRDSGNMSMGALHRAGFSPAYVVTNEDLRTETKLSIGNNKRVLTVAASGDQALFYLLAGATHIDTYDMTLTAKIIQEIKFAAIRQQVPYQAYMYILTQLHNGATDLMNIPYMSDIIQDTSPTTAHFIKNVKCPLHFSYGCAPCDKNKQYLLTPDEYATLQAMRPQTPSFIWSNVTDLHHNIRGKYDVINTSNIFDYTPNSLPHVVNNLRKHLTADGAIITESNYPETDYALNQVAKNFPGELDVTLTKNKLKNLARIQRTR